LELEEVVIGGYRRMSIMQTGQNSEVWQVCDVVTQRQIAAMKLLLPEREHDRAQQRAMKHESKVGLMLQHPKIIRTFKFGRDKHIVFILMEYFPSLNLKLRLMRKQYENFIRPKLRSILMQTAQGLEYMHSLKWVHRDVKPDNILVDSIGNVKLIDFALAVKSASAFAKKFGRRGVTAGTRSYMSPEQIRGKPVDIRADIYSFGVLIYEIVAGRLPFVGQSAADLLRKHIFEAPPPIDKARKVTPEFEKLLHKLLAKKEEDRVQTMADFMKELRLVRIFTDETAEQVAGADGRGRP
jgi:eukaryotic-like serine/threonine-protein kinase